MRAKILIVSLIVFLIALFGASQTTAQDPPLDLGEPDVIALGCDYIRDLIEYEGYQMRWCRLREEGVVLSENEALLKLYVRDSFNSKQVPVELKLRKSLWQIERLTITN